jgi:cytidine deaminase
LAVAEDAMNDFYDPYSEFSVGAALATPDGKIFRGVNVGNAAYGSTICAERSAIVHAYSKGYRIFECLAIIARGKDFDTKDVTGPCGACRQMMYELQQVSGTELKVVMSTTRKDKIVIATMDELLPLAFGPLDLGMDISKFRKERRDRGTNS